MNYKISDKAFEDIDFIWLYTIETWSVQQADKYYNLIFDAIEFIAEYPMIGRDYDTIRKQYRGFTVGSHVIFYRYKKHENTLEIIRILHQSMDIEQRLME